MVALRTLLIAAPFTLIGCSDNIQDGPVLAMVSLVANDPCRLTLSATSTGFYTSVLPTMVVRIEGCVSPEVKP